MSELDKAARMAMEANVKIPIHRKIWRGIKSANRAVYDWWAKQPPIIAIIFGIFALAVLCGISGWEALNSARGWVMLANGAAPPQLAFVAGFCVTIGYIVFHRRASERMRTVRDLKIANSVDQVKTPLVLIDNAKGRAWKATVTAIVFASLSLFGVFSNLASKTGITAEEAKENNEGRTQLQVRQITLENELSTFNEPLVSALIKADESRLKSLKAEASGWGMADLDPDGACAADLSQRQRQLCNAANGSVGADGRVIDGITGTLETRKASLEDFRGKLAELEDVKAQIRDSEVIEGEQHWEAMSTISYGKIPADAFRIWGMFIASMLFLFGAGLGWDELFEQAEKRDLI